MKHLLLTAIVASSLMATTAFASPIHSFARINNTAGVQAELDKGIDPNLLAGWDKMTPLHVAVDFEAKEVVQLLIDNGANVDALGGWRNTTPLWYASYAGFWGIVEILINAGADLNVKALGNAPVYYPITPLGLAVWGGGNRGEIKVVELLIEAGADANGKAALGEITPLREAVRTSQNEIIILLINADADVNFRDKRGFTPLHIAASLKKGKEIAELLISAGSNVNTKNNIGKTPLDYAIAFKDTDTADLLRKHGGKTGKKLAMLPRLMQHNRFSFSFGTKEGELYEVQDSFDLINWEVIETYTGTGDSIRFYEERDHDLPQLFYRVRMVE